MTVKIFVGVDGGGTKTAAAVMDETGRELSRGTSGPSNFYTVGRPVAEVSLRGAIEQALNNAQLTTADVTAIGLGMAGVDRPGDRAIVRDILDRLGDFDRAVIVNDAEAALVGGIGRRFGAVLIAGTGAIAYGVNANGEARRADGWGYVVGDEGSAHWIGVQGLRAVARAHDGRGPQTALTDSLIAHLRLPEIEALVTLIYGADFGVPQLAGLAPLVSQAGQAGDPVAQNILRQAGQRLGSTLSAVLCGLDMVDDAFDVVLMGGVLRVGGLVRKTVVAGLGQTTPRARVVEPRHDAAIGAALLAQQMGE